MHEWRLVKRHICGQTLILGFVTMHKWRFGDVLRKKMHFLGSGKSSRKISESPKEKKTYLRKIFHSWSCDHAQVAVWSLQKKKLISEMVRALGKLDEILVSPTGVEEYYYNVKALHGFHPNFSIIIF